MWRQSFPQDILALSLSFFHRYAICLEEYTFIPVQTGKDLRDELVQPGSDLHVTLHLNIKLRPRGEVSCSGHTASQRQNQNCVCRQVLFHLHHDCLSLLCSRVWCHSDFKAKIYKCHFLSWKTSRGLSSLLPWEPVGLSLSLILTLFWLNFERFISLHFGARQTRVHYHSLLALWPLVRQVISSHFTFLISEMGIIYQST